MNKPYRPVPLIIVALLAIAGIYWVQSGGRKAESLPVAEVSSVAPAGGYSKALASGAMAAFIVKEPRTDIPAFEFTAADGTRADLSKWKGRVVLLNLWATWCAPCRKEMPDLVELQKQLGGKDFEVVALSVDAKGAEASGAFLKEVGADALTVYADPAMKSMTALQAIGLPATLLIDRTGKEAGRILGPAPWSSPEAIQMVKALIAEKP